MLPGIFVYITTGQAMTISFLHTNISQTFSQAGRYGPPRHAKRLRLRGVCRNNTVMACPGVSIIMVSF